MATPSFLKIHDVTPGMSLRIALKAGKHLNPTPFGTMKKDSRPRVARAFAETVFFCQVMQIDLQNGTMDVCLNKKNRVNRKAFTATINFADILNAAQYVTGQRPITETAPVTHPGAKALGSTSNYGLLHLIPIRF